MSRHNHLQDALYETAVAAGLGTTKEGRFLLPGEDRRIADVLISNWAGGRDAALDVTMINNLQEAMMAEAATNPGHALAFAFERRISGAEEDCRRQGIAFLPMAAEREVKKLVAALVRHTGQEKGEALCHLWHRLGNAAILGNKIPSHPTLNVNGNQ